VAYALCPQQNKAKCFFAITPTVVHKFPSNLADCYSNQGWTVYVKTIHFTWFV